MPLTTDFEALTTKLVTLMTDFAAPATDFVTPAISVDAQTAGSVTSIAFPVAFTASFVRSASSVQNFPLV